MPCFKKVNEGVMLADMFSQKILFTYNGKGAFKTFIGGSISIAIIIFMLFYSILQMYHLITKTTITTNKNSQKKNWRTGESPINMTQSGIRIAVSWRDSEGVPIDPSIGRIIPKKVANLPTLRTTKRTLPINI